MLSIFSTGKANNPKILNITDSKLIDFDQALNNVMLNLAKRVVADGEGSSKFVTIKVKNCNTEKSAKERHGARANG